MSDGDESAPPDGVTVERQVSLRRASQSAPPGLLRHHSSGGLTRPVNAARGEAVAASVANTAFLVPKPFDEAGKPRRRPSHGVRIVESFQEMAKVGAASVGPRRHSFDVFRSKNCRR